MKIKLLLFTLLVCLTTSSFATGVVQENWRWNNDDASGTQIANENTAITINNTNTLRIRIMHRRKEATFNGGTATATNTLRYTSVANPEDTDWKTIENPGIIGTAHFELVETSAHATHGGAITSGILQKNAAATTFINGMYILRNDGTASAGVTIPNADINKYTEVEYFIRPTSNAQLNTTYYFSTNNGEYTWPNVPTLSIGAVLPVNFISFEAKPENNGVNLKWATASQQNNDKFVVERSIDGKNWTVVSTVKGEGNSSSKNEYSVLDQSPQNGANYYQLKQYDLDGTVTLLASKSVNFNLQPTGVAVSVYPNPTFGDVSFILNDFKGAAINATLITTQGKIVHAERFLSNSANLYKLNLGTKPNVGMYILKVEGEGFSVSKNILVN